MPWISSRWKNVPKYMGGMAAAALLGRVEWRAVPAVLKHVLGGAVRGDPVHWQLETIPPASKLSPLSSSFDPERVSAVFDPMEWHFGGRHGRIGTFPEFLDFTGTGAFLALWRGRLIWDWYAKGLRPDHAFRLKSASKTLVSTLVGVAVGEKRLGLGDYPHAILGIPLNERTSPPTVESLLRMQLQPTPYGRLGHMVDWVTETYPYDVRALARRGLTQRSKKDAKRFSYGETSCWLLALVLEKLYGASLARLLFDKLWQPLGMEFPCSWITDRNGVAAAGIGCMATARDLARLGCFFLAGGVVEGRTLLPPDWLARAWSPPPEEGAEYYASVRDWPQLQGIASPFYGYCWWGARRDGAHPDVYAVGSNAQLLFLSPAHEIAFVRLGREPNWFDGWVPLLYRAAPRLAAAKASQL